MGNNFSSKYELFRNVKADDKKGLNRNYGIFLVLRRKTGLAGAVGADQAVAVSFREFDINVFEERFFSYA